MTEWIRSYENGIDYVESIGGVMWGEAPLPRWLHRCRPQTRGMMGADYVERCNCGAHGDGKTWAGKNETRRGRRRARRIARSR
jgi:hypothetical protein